MRRTGSHTSLVAALIAMLLGCGSMGPGSEGRTDTQAPPGGSGSALAESTPNSTFALGLLSKVSTAMPPGENLLIAPVSISTTLAMLAAGAKGETARQVTAALGFSGVDEMTSSVAATTTSLAAMGDQQVQLTQANRVWAQTGLEFKPAYLQTLAQAYRSAIGALDFVASPDAARTKINDWVEAKTSGTIKDMLPSGAVNSATRVVLTNALHLKASWSSPFDSNLTTTQTFRAPSAAKPVRMMHQTAHYLYSESDLLKFIEIPYGRGRLVMDIMLPQVGAVLQPWGHAISSAGLAASARMRPVSLSLPAFSFPTSASLVSSLKAMGMAKVFDGSGDFSLMTDQTQLAVSDVLHKTYISVSEQGTEAGASTAVVISTSSAEPLADFTADHPFLFQIIDKSTDTVIMAGTFNGPA